jgi:CrcB protein
VGAQVRVVAAVAVGGAAGSVARHGVGLALPHPLGTLAVNLSGCLLIGMLVARHRHDALLRALLGTGVLGGWTTFSTASTDAVALAQAGEPLLATVYTAATLALSVAAAAAGLHLGRPREGGVR